MSTTPHTPHHDTFREGAAEVKDKLRSDIANLSRWTRVRRFVSLSPTMICPDCEGGREVACSACGGVGKQHTAWNNEEVVCEHCSGKGVENCPTCFGRGRVKNIHRKKFLILLGIGAAAWAFILFKLWGGDVLPEQRAKYLNGGGGGGVAQVRISPRGGKVAPPIPAGPGVPGPGLQSGAQVPGGPSAVQNPGSGVAAPPQTMPGGPPMMSPRGGQMMPHGAPGGTNQ